MRSHGDGRRMTVAEAVERRARMIRFHGSLEKAYQHGHQHVVTDPECNEMPRAWSSWFCHLQLERERDGFECDGSALAVDDVIEDTMMFENGPHRCIVSACPACRGAA
jgi:hypothetical protein